MLINFPPTDLATAPCTGPEMYKLFDSRAVEDHRKAKALCATCPAIAACSDQLQTVLNSPSNLGGTPEGTWAGRLYGKAESPPKRVACGTPAGYHRHRHFKEVRCEPCKAAHRQAEAERAAGKMAS